MNEFKCRHCGGLIIQGLDGPVCLMCGRSPASERVLIQLADEQTASCRPITAVIWLGTSQVAQQKGESERRIRYQLEVGRIPGIKDEEGRWHVPPAVIGDNRPSVFSCQGMTCQVIGVGPVLGGEVIRLSHMIPGDPLLYQQRTSGATGPLFASATSGQMVLLTSESTSGWCGYVWVTGGGLR